jgi:hypothetical protein
MSPVDEILDHEVNVTEPTQALLSGTLEQGLPQFFIPTLSGFKHGNHSADPGCCSTPYCGGHARAPLLYSSRNTRMSTRNTYLHQAMRIIDLGDHRPCGHRLEASVHHQYWGND